MKKEEFIGFFDSGVGGLSVLKYARTQLPKENFIFYADCGHFPFGTKTPEEVKEFTLKACEEMYRYGAKAFLIACNTATSASIHALRDIYKIPVVSMEPAVKPAIEASATGKIAVLATPATIASPRYGRLISKLGCEDRLLNIKCYGLADIVEKGNFESPEVYSYIRDIFNDIKDEDVSGAVLGCTHYSFVKNAINNVARDVFGKTIGIYDGMYGTVKRLASLLAEQDMLNENGNADVKVLTSGTEKDCELINRILKMDISF